MRLRPLIDKRKNQNISRWTALLLLTAFLGTGCGASGSQGPSASTNKSKAEAGDVAGQWMPVVLKEYLENGPRGRHLPDFSRAGYLMGEHPIPDTGGPVFDVTESRFGAVPDDGVEDTAAVQAAIESAGAAGGGVVYLPKGRYDIHQTPDSPYLRITHDHVVLRGQGADPSGTILFLGAPGKAAGIRRFGSVPAEKEGRQYAVISVTGSEERRELAMFTRDVVRGERDIEVSDTGNLSAGQAVVIECVDPLIDPEHPSPEKADLSVRLTSPFRLAGEHSDTFGIASRKHFWIAGIEKVVDGHTVKLTRPARFDQPLRYSPTIYSFAGVHGVGIEHLRIESAWQGGYRHHKPYEGPDGAILRSAREQDYLWTGIWISAAVDGWVRDVTFKDLTQGIILSCGADWTIQDVRFQGIDGHAGITIGASNDTLVERADFHARLVHPITLSTMAAGNVVTDCEVHYEGRDPITQTDTAIDFHGLFPYENLFEKMKGFYVFSGGDVCVLPHAGVRNVFWNIQAPGRMDGIGSLGGNSFVQTDNYVGTSSKTPETMYEHLPRAFYIGITRRENRIVTLGNSSEDRRTEWMTVEGIGRPGIAVPSLYEAQRNNARNHP